MTSVLVDIGAPKTGDPSVLHPIFWMRVVRRVSHTPFAEALA